MISETHLLSNAVSNFLKNERGVEKQQRQCALEVVFFNADKVEEFQAMIAPVAPNLQRYGKRLISFYPSQDKAQKVANDIGSILYDFDSALIKQDFKADWLSEYLQLGHYGVNYAGASHELTSPGQISAYLDKRNKSSLEQQAYKAKDLAAKSKALAYTNAQMAEDFAQFLASNWEGFNDADQAKQLMHGLIDIMEQETRGQYHFSSSPAQRTLMAMKDKAKYLANLENAGDKEKQVAVVMNQYAIKDEFEKLTKQNGGNQRWAACAKRLEAHINKNAPGITLKGLSELLEDEDAKVDKHIAFTGIDLSHDYVADMNKRLSPRTLRYDIQEQGYRQSEQLAGAIAAYYLTVMELKQEAKFKELLIEHSKVMDKEPFFDCLLDLAARSKPDYQETTRQHVNTAAKALVGDKGMESLKEVAVSGNGVEQEHEAE